MIRIIVQNAPNYGNKFGADLDICILRKHMRREQLEENQIDIRGSLAAGYLARHPNFAPA